MNILKKIGAPLVAVALVAAMGVSLIGGQQTASAATVTTRADNAQITTGAAGSAVTLVLTLTAAELQNTQTLILTTPAGFSWIGAPTIAIGAAPATTLTINAAAVMTGNNFVATWTATANNNAAAVVTISGFIRNIGNVTANAGVGTLATIGGSSGVIAMTGTGVAANTDVGSLNTAYVSPFTITMSTNPNASSLPADGSQQISIQADILDANSIPAGNRLVTWTTSVGFLSTGVAKSTTSSSAVTAGANGRAVVTYRGNGGIVTTDTIIASISSGNAVGTLSMPLTAPAGNTAAKLTITAPTVSAIAPAANNVTPAYSSPTIGSNVALQVTDASGLGVNGQVTLISVDKGSIVVNPAFATANANTICAGVVAKSITANSLATNLNAPGATANSAGWVNFAICANQVDAVGQITVTAQNVSTSMANATTTLSHAGRPGKITATVSGAAIAVKVTDAGGNNVADGTPVRFTMSANAGAVSVGCTTTTNGAASAVVALVAPTGTVIVSADYNEGGSVATASTCAAAGTQQIAASAVIGAGGGTSTNTTPPAAGTAAPAAGAGTFAAAPVYSASKLAQVVFNGGTVAQLEAAVTAANGTGVWAQDSKGVFVLYIVGGGFVNDAFKAAFPNGFAGVTAITVVGK